MGSELLEDSQPTIKKYSELFEDVLPTYLSMGMTYEQFYRDDPKLVIYYRKADELRLQRTNFEHWLLGKYIDEALAVNLSNMFRKKGEKANKFRNEPYQFNSLNEEEVKRKQEIQAEAWMHNLVNMYK